MVALDNLDEQLILKLIDTLKAPWRKNTLRSLRLCNKRFYHLVNKAVSQIRSEIRNVNHDMMFVKSDPSNIAINFDNFTNLTSLELTSSNEWQNCYFFTLSPMSMFTTLTKLSIRNIKNRVEQQFVVNICLQNPIMYLKFNSYVFEGKRAREVGFSELVSEKVFGNVYNILCSWTIVGYMNNLINDTLRDFYFYCWGENFSKYESLQLTALELFDANQDDLDNSLRYWKDLKSLALSESFFENNGILQLSSPAFSRLTKLEIYTKNIALIEQSYFTQLEHLVIQGEMIDQINRVKLLSQLRELELIDILEPQPIQDFLKELSQLTFLRLVFSTQFDPRFVKDLLCSISQLSDLVHLDLGSCGRSVLEESTMNKYMQYIFKLTNLEELNLNILRGILVLSDEARETSNVSVSLEKLFQNFSQALPRLRYLTIEE
eukprot:TRINITY_DN6111_c1_g1_i1.p1 TRINITY_DN6111_c1_g1~~TRINITY_DN6111_c1_g1_i1.p1  ORF type:complete len:433 (-),score=27.47 TRINITY_DN6111_c1_g1_i1:593-1891(-)